MALILEVEFLAGVCFAASGPESEAPDWPPQPDRVFSALVATWGAHGECADERTALEWLEALEPPHCEAGEISSRSAPVVFVPPNDPRSDRGKHAASVLPAARKRQPRRFPAARLSEHTMRHRWTEEPPEDVLLALQRIARDTAYIGHSASLTRCRFLLERQEAAGRWQAPARRVYPGRLRELLAAHARFLETVDKKDRPAPGAPVVPGREPERYQRQNAFSPVGLILEHIGGEMPDLRAFAIVARGIRMALMSGYGQLRLPIPEWVSGHAQDGRPSQEPHLAVVPLPFAGFPYADGRVLGFALFPPAGINLVTESGFRRVMRELAPLRPRQDRRIMEVKSPIGTVGEQAFAIWLAPTFESPATRRSLDLTIYTRSSRRFATVTPIVLDRHLKERGEARHEEVAKLIEAACGRIGLPAPRLVHTYKHCPFEGVPSAYPSGNAPSWMGWRLPRSLQGRQLTHAIVEFDAVVDGPVILGAGRFVGLGLCRAIEERT